MPTATAERLIIKNRAELLRTIKREGLVIRVVRHFQPHLENTTRTVQKAQTNGYFFYADRPRNGDGKPERVRMWAEIPKASSILFCADGEVTFHPGEDKHWTLTFELPAPEPHTHASRAEERVCEAQAEDDRHDWQNDVANGDTVLGLAEWIEHKREADCSSNCGCYLNGEPPADCPHAAAVQDLEPPTNTVNHRDFTDSEVATILHGLRMIQEEGRLQGCNAGDCDHFDETEQLTNAQIDDLCERINLGDLAAKGQ